MIKGRTTITRSSIYLVITLLSLVSISLQWHDVGHMTVARIARIHLQKTSQGTKALNLMEAILNPLVPLCGEKKHPFTECASWPDKIKAQGWYSMEEWHYDDKPLLKDGYNPTTPVPKAFPHNVVWAIGDSLSTLTTKKVDTLGKTDKIFGQSISLRNLIHFIGDIHQPLHCVSRFSAEHPKGDMGGNLFKILYFPGGDSDQNNLHFLWDHMLGYGNQDIYSPVTEEQYEYLSKMAQDIIDEFKDEAIYKKLLAMNITPESWAEESYKTAQNFVYKGIQEGGQVSDQYIRQGRVIALRRIALAGERLANKIVSILQAQLELQVQSEE